MKISESDVLKQILEYLKLKGFLAWRNHTQAVLRTIGKNTYFTPNSNKGAPDILGVFPDGKMFAIEVKTPGKKLDKYQVVWRDRLLTSGVKWTIAHSLDDVMDVIH